MTIRSSLRSHPLTIHDKYSDHVNLRNRQKKVKTDIITNSAKGRLASVQFIEGAGHLVRPYRHCIVVEC